MRRSLFILPATLLLFPILCTLLNAQQSTPSSAIAARTASTRSSANICPTFRSEPQAQVYLTLPADPVGGTSLRLARPTENSLRVESANENTPFECYGSISVVPSVLGLEEVQVKTDREVPHPSAFQHCLDFHGESVQASEPLALPAASNTNAQFE